MILDLRESCEYCLDRRRPVKPVEPEFAEWTFAGIRADYRCGRCGGCWYATWNPEAVADVLTGEAAA